MACQHVEEWPVIHSLGHNEEKQLRSMETIVQGRKLGGFGAFP